MNQYENRFYARTEQPIVFFARIENAENGVLLDPTGITAIRYSAWSLGAIDGLRKQNVPGHLRVNVPLSALYETAVASVAFPNGYNFRFGPDNRAKPLFPRAGNYEVLFHIESTDQNPIVLTYRFEVE